MSKIIINGTEVDMGGSSLPSGGTTGQVLTKESNADGDVGWKDSGGGSGETYSTEERRIGTWIDGKAIYRRTFRPVGLNTSGTIATLQNVNEVVAMYGVGYSSNDNDSIVTLPFNSSVTSRCIPVYTPSSGVFSILIGGSTSVITITIEYTKTTD